jgi:hypothetical protein
VDFVSLVQLLAMGGFSDDITDNLPNRKAKEHINEDLAWVTSILE